MQLEIRFLKISLSQSLLPLPISSEPVKYIPDILILSVLWSFFTFHEFQIVRDSRAILQMHDKFFSIISLATMQPNNVLPLPCTGELIYNPVPCLQKLSKRMIKLFSFSFICPFHFGTRDHITAT